MCISQLFLKPLIRYLRAALSDPGFWLEPDLFFFSRARGRSRLWNLEPESKNQKGPEPANLPKRQKSRRHLFLPIERSWSHTLNRCRQEGRFRSHSTYTAVISTGIMRVYTIDCGADDPPGSSPARPGYSGWTGGWCGPCSGRQT